MQGFFLAIEGIDGCGKSTQCKRISEWVGQCGVQVFQPQDPGTSEAGKLIREILLIRKEVHLHPRTQAALFAAARCELAHSYIKPFLRAGAMVVGDRWTTSTVVYQHYGAQGTRVDLLSPGGGFTTEPASPLSPHQIEMLCDTLVDSINPDLTIILDLTVEEARIRTAKKDPDRFEQMDQEFHERLRSGYLAVAGRPGYSVLDVGKLEPDEVFSKIQSLIVSEARKRGESSCLWRFAHEGERGVSASVGD